MSSATELRRVADQRTAGAAELVVERDGGSPRGEAGTQPHAQVAKGAGAVALKREDVLEGPEDRLDPLADGRELRATPALVLAGRTHDPGIERGHLGLEALAAEALVPDHDQQLPGPAFATGDELQANLALVDLRRGQRQSPRGAVGREQGVQAKAEEVAAVACAVAVVGGVRQRDGETRVPAALDGLAGAGTLHRSEVDQQQIIEEAGALAGEMGVS